jgi:DNA-binding NarL/FixJ family response regulator
MQTTVLLVDDHALIRQGIRRAFEQTDDLVVVAEAAGLQEGLALERRHEPDVAVVDIHLGDGTGLDLVRAMRARRPEVGLVVLTMSDGDDHLFAALDAGASAFVLKGAPSDDVVAAARAARAAPSSFTATHLAAAMRRRLQGPSVQLTGREEQILHLLGEGLSVSQVAQRLYISPSTTKTHMARLYDKLGANNRTQAIMAAVRLGLLTTDAAVSS